MSSCAACSLRSEPSMNFACLRRTKTPRGSAWLFIATSFVCVLAVAPPAIPVAQTRIPVPGDALPGITPVEFQEFRLGLDDFLEVETSDEGLGPAFNATSCAVCHSVPAVGGMSAIAEVRAGKRGPNGEFIALDPSGESLFHLFSVPGHSCQPVIPVDATII